MKIFINSYWLSLGLAGLILTGCATTPPSLANIKPVPKERLYDFQTKTDKTTATLTVTRDSGFLGGGCFYAFSINSKLAARLNPAESTRFYVEPGELLIRTSRDPQGKGLCAIGQDDWTQRETIIHAGENKTFRMTIDQNGKADVMRSDY